MSGGFTAPDLSGWFSNTPPSSEATTAVAGGVDQASRTDHQHPRLTSTATGTLGSNGEATITFTRTFATKPVVSILLVESADNQPIIFKVKSWSQDAQNRYTGCVIKGYRLNTLPATITLLSALVSFSISAGTAVGAEYSLIALQPSA